MILTAKTKALLTHCHSLLLEAESLTEQGKGTSIVEEEKESLLRESGLKIINYCERNGCTKYYLNRFNIRHKAMFDKFKKYYDICIKNYEKHIASVGDGHIPILYAVIMLQELRINKLIGLDLEYDELIETIKKSKHLQGKKRQSKFAKGQYVTDLNKFTKYHTCVHHAIKNVMESKKAAS